ncbi:hypothetical protein GDO78_014240 [Eleutherodactylus coqui]|uniref:Uncharacterized protein n=1 Tax=Eleutherodactylus coqui TaxID=57060 RepID=A0A8J6B1J5_ELECQ|nr:hypothetical protein GDO78_014240 [Eleutherodactylus coqui]
MALCINIRPDIKRGCYPQEPIGLQLSFLHWVMIEADSIAIYCLHYLYMRIHFITFFYLPLCLFALLMTDRKRVSRVNSRGNVYTIPIVLLSYLCT